MTTSPLVEVLERSKARGFLGPGPVASHLDHAEAFLAAATAPRRLLDLGSGGGVPGLILAVAWPHSSVVLLDAQVRRVRFLVEAIAVLGVGDRVTAVHARAEDLAREPGHRGRYDVVTARSFGPPAVTAECAAGFLTAGGVLLVSEPPETTEERWPPDGLAVVGLADDGVAAAPAGSVRRLRSVAGPVDGVPRRIAAMRRRPAWP